MPHIIGYAAFILKRVSADQGGEMRQKSGRVSTFAAPTGLPAATDAKLVVIGAPPLARSPRAGVLMATQLSVTVRPTDTPPATFPPWPKRDRIVMSTPLYTSDGFPVNV